MAVLVIFELVKLRAVELVSELDKIKVVGPCEHGFTHLFCRCESKNCERKVGYYVQKQIFLGVVDEIFFHEYSVLPLGHLVLAQNVEEDIRQLNVANYVIQPMCFVLNVEQ